MTVSVKEQNKMHGFCIKMKCSKMETEWSRLYCLGKCEFTAKDYMQWLKDSGLKTASIEQKRVN
jgi:hypothetical protein